MILNTIKIKFKDLIIKKINSFSIIKSLLIVLPFTFIFFFETTNYNYVSSKVLSLAIIIFIIMIIFLFNIHKNSFIDFIIIKFKNLLKNKIFISISIFVLLSLFSTLNSKHILNSFSGTYTRWDGFLTLFCIYIFFVLANIFFNKKNLKFFLFNFLITSILIFFSVMISFNMKLDRPSSFLGNPIFIGQFFLLSFFFLFNFLEKSKKELKSKSKNILTVFFILIYLTGIFISGTRGVVFGVFVSFAILMIFWFFSKTKIYFGPINSKQLATFSLIIITIFSVTLFSTRKLSFWQDVPLVNRIVNIGTNDATTMSRLLNNKISYNIATHPENILDFLVGVGPEEYARKWYEYYNPELYVYDQAIFDRSHNFIFDILIMKGILGLISFLYIIYTGIKESRNLSFYMFSTTIFVLMAYIIQGLFAFDSYTATILFFMIFLFLIKDKDE